jgi:hypothetical protein
MRRLLPNGRRFLRLHCDLSRPHDAFSFHNKVQGVVLRRLWDFRVLLPSSGCVCLLFPLKSDHPTSPRPFIGSFIAFLTLESGGKS